MSLAAAPEITAESLLAINALCSAEAARPAGFTPDLKLAAGMGTGGFKVDTQVKAAQEWFNYGLTLSHAFYHQDAKAAMKRAVQLDPTCSLCAWGEAWVLGPTLNYGIEEDERVVALAAAERSKALAKPGDTKALRLAEIMIARYASPAPKDDTKKDAKAGEAGVCCGRCGHGAGVCRCAGEDRGGLSRRGGVPGSGGAQPDDGLERGKAGSV